MWLKPNVLETFSPTATYQSTYKPGRGLIQNVEREQTINRLQSIYDYRRFTSDVQST